MRTYRSKNCKPVSTLSCMKNVFIRLIFTNKFIFKMKKDLISRLNDGPVIFDCIVTENENVYPMIPSGKAHNEMLLGNESEKEEISEEGKVLL